MTEEVYLKPSREYLTRSSLFDQLWNLRCTTTNEVLQDQIWQILLDPGKLSLTDLKDQLQGLTLLNQL